MKCPACGFENYPSARYCAACHRTAGTTPTQTMPVPVAPPPPAPPRRVAPLVWAVVAVVLLGLVGAAAIVALRMRQQPVSASPGPARTTAASARDQAASIDALLDRSAASRAKLNGAIERVQRCTGLAGALADMRAVGVERTGQIADTESVDVSALTNGERVRSSLKSALDNALAADREFVAWAGPAVTGGCAETPARRAAWDRGQASSGKAQAAKKQLVAVWNPVAAQFGLRQRTTQAI